MSDAGDKQAFKAALKEIIDAFDRSQSPSAVDGYAGVSNSDPLEHTTRVNLLDELIKALGWRLSSGKEIVEEARLQSETTLFIDYLGVDPEKKTPLLIIEAKAWNKPFIRPRDGRVKGETGELLQKAIAHIRLEEDPTRSPLILEWHEWLVQVRDYVKGLREKHNHSVQRLVITSGQWMIIFSKPVQTFCTDEPLDNDQWMILRKESFVEESDDIYDLIARKNLVKSPPRLIRETQLLAFFRKDDLAGVFHSLLVKHEKTGHSHVRVVPQIQIYPSITLLRRDGHTISIHDGKGSFSIPFKDDGADLKEHFKLVDEAAKALLQTVSLGLNASLQPFSLENFSGFPSRPRHNAVTAIFQGDLGISYKLFVDMDPTHPGEGVIVTGNLTHFLLPIPSKDCQFHEWANCRRKGVETGTHSIDVRSVEPRSFFKSGELHHCAHNGMHSQRSDRCKIDPIDRYICCMACAFKVVCWPESINHNLPCGT